MTRNSTKDAAEALLRQLPSVIGACVREDVNGHPREVHLLVRAGPNLRHFAYDVRDLLEERLGLPVDQRIISIAQLAPGRQPGPRLAAAAALPDAPDTTETAQTTGAAGAAAAETAAAQADFEGQAVHRRDAVPVAETEPAYPRVRFAGITTESMDNRVRVEVSLAIDDESRAGEAVGLDTAPARLRTVAAATLHAADATCTGRARFEVEHVATIGSFQRDYVLVSVLASSPYLGRAPVQLVGAHPVELDAESAAALAALKAINRTLSLMLRLPTGTSPRARPRSARA
jgi:hypothetical protein